MNEDYKLGSMEGHNEDDNYLPGDNMYYIYNIETKEIVATTDNIDAVQYDYDWDLYGATESPAFGTIDGLIK